MEEEEVRLPKKGSESPFDEGVVVGIDLGTSNSVLAFWHLDKDRVKVLKDSRGIRTTPSIVRWAANGPEAIGASALDADSSGKISVQNSSSYTIRCVKRIIGKRFDDQSVQEIKSSLPFEVAAGGIEDKEAGIRLATAANDANPIWISPIDVSATIISDLKGRAEEYLRRARRFKAMSSAPKSITKAVVGVPVYFTESQRLATRSALIKAGFTDVAIMAESTAAAVAYGLFVTGKKNVLVFDAGGGTTDVTLMHIDDGKFSTIATTGDNQLGGEDMDTAIVGLVQQKVADLGLNSSPDYLSPMNSYLRAKCSDARVRLSTDLAVDVKLRINKAEGGEMEVKININRGEFEEAIAPLVARARDLVVSVLDKKCLGSSNQRGDGRQMSDDKIFVDEVVLVGGASRTPALREMLRNVFPHLPDLCTSIDAHTSVAEGLAIRGAIAAQVTPDVLRHCLMTDVLPMDIGVEIFVDGEAKIDGFHNEIEDDKGSRDDSGGYMDVVLPKNTKLPASSLRSFRCESPNQAGVSIDLFEGNEERARENDYVGRFTFMISRRCCSKEVKDKQLAGQENDMKNSDSMIKSFEYSECEHPREVLLRFTMTETRFLSVEIVDDDFDGDFSKKNTGVTSEQKMRETFLLATIIILAILYITLRVTAKSKLESEFAEVEVGFNKNQREL